MDYKNPEWYVELFQKYGLVPQQGSAQVIQGGTCAMGIAMVEFGIEGDHDKTGAFVELEQKRGETHG